jgi:choline dehydrogenase-like flavoprotein
VSIRYLEADDPHSQFGREIYDFCIIGAGAAGIYLATRLAEGGKRVVVVEAGGKASKSAFELGFEPVFTAHQYSGALEGRAFGLGGTTARWGGALVPHTELDIPTHNENTFAAWKSIVEAVKAHGTNVLRNLGYDHIDPFQARSLRGSSIRPLVVQPSIHAPFRSRNFGRLLDRICLTGTITFLLHSVAARWTVKESGDKVQIIAVEALSSGRQRVGISAASFIVAAGALESARILLEIARDAGRPLHPAAAVGCYLSDHLSAKVGDVLQPDRAADAFGPRFVGRWMTSYRFIDAARDENLPRWFGHLVFEIDGAAFSIARTVLASLQQRKRPAASPREVVVALGGLLKLADARYRRGLLHIPRGTKVHLRLDMEQLPVRDNCIRLGKEIDAYGRPRAEVHWRTSNADAERMQECATRLIKLWSKPETRLPALGSSGWLLAPSKIHDAYHPVGTCMMGEHGDAVVDTALRVRGAKNLWSISTGVLPSAGAANPTFTMLCLAERLSLLLLEGSERNKSPALIC